MLIKENTGRPEGLIISQSTPSVEPVTTAEVKAFLKIDYSTDDTLIAEMIIMAREFVENFLQRALINRTVTAEWTNTGTTVYLPIQPCSTITSVTRVYENETTELLVENDDYFVKGSKDKTIKLAASNTGLQVIYTAGYGTAASSVPSAIKHAILRIIATYYEHREDNVIGTIAATTDMNSLRLLSTFRNIAI